MVQGAIVASAFAVRKTLASIVAGQASSMQARTPCCCACCSNGERHHYSVEERSKSAFLHAARCSMPSNVPTTVAPTAPCATHFFLH